MKQQKTHRETLPQILATCLNKTYYKGHLKTPLISKRGTEIIVSIHN